MSSLQDLTAFAPESKVWVFTANRKMSDEEVAKINDKLQVFSRAWISHSNKLKSEAFVLHNLFVILVVDNSQAMASGCSIDTAMRFIQTLQIDFNIDFLDRQSFVYLDESNQIQLIRKNELQNAVDSGKINDDTLFYDNLIEDLNTLKTDFIKPRASFWMKNM